MMTQRAISKKTRATTPQNDATTATKATTSTVSSKPSPPDFPPPSEAAENISVPKVSTPVVQLVPKPSSAQHKVIHVSTRF